MSTKAQGTKLLFQFWLPHGSAHEGTAALLRSGWPPASFGVLYGSANASRNLSYFAEYLL